MVTQDGDDTVITFAESDGSITLANVNPGMLDTTDFIFHQKISVDGIWRLGTGVRRSRPPPLPLRPSSPHRRSGKVSETCLVMGHTLRAGFEADVPLAVRRPRGMTGAISRKAGAE